MIPSIGEADIRQWVGVASFDRGHAYFLDEHIINVRLQGAVLKGQCYGSEAEPYRVSVTLGPQGIISDNCSCYLGGNCKHVAALLLFWIHNPDAVVPEESAASVLEALSREDLVSLILKMLDRHPDLEKLLEVPRIVAQGPSGPVDAKAIRKQAKSLLTSHRYEDEYEDDWDAGGEAFEGLNALLETADAHFNAAAWQNAAVIYKSVADEIIEFMDDLEYDSDILTETLDSCAEGLGRCLTASDAPSDQLGVLKALFDIYRSGADYGGYGQAIPAMISEGATREARAQVVQWVEAQLSASGKEDDGERRTAWGAMLLALLQDSIDDESYLNICRETGRIFELVERLLKLGRIEEAVVESEDSYDTQILGLANLFVEAGYSGPAESLVRDRLNTSPQLDFLVWLKDRSKESGNLKEALALAERLFGSQPVLSRYTEIREIAAGLNAWEDLRPQFLSRLADQKQHSLLTEIYLQEGDIERAIESVDALAEARQNGVWMGGWYGGGLSLKVAEAAEAGHPTEAIRLYMAEVYRLISGRKRDYYAQAAHLLVRVRALHLRTGRKEAWETLLADIRDQRPILPALRDELKRAGL
ncbi:MAG: SWIM zinc finger family protein [Armatimonadetes bacterium]|nr:SWIM zinc finger family protein [Armatimonadota bacterium]